MNTGHEGSLTTIHANSAHDALARLEMMVALAGFEVPVDVVRQYIALGISIVVHLARLQGGVRRVMQVSEIIDVEDGKYRLQPLFGFRQTGVSDGVAVGDFFAAGNLPRCLDRLNVVGEHIPESLFEKRDLPPA
jgi:pilus assembly protein CpaF